MRWMIGYVGVGGWKTWCTYRCVCAPQYRSACTEMKPMLSFSSRVAMVVVVVEWKRRRGRMGGWRKACVVMMGRSKVEGRRREEMAEGRKHKVGSNEGRSMRGGKWTPVNRRRPRGILEGVIGCMGFCSTGGLDHPTTQSKQTQGHSSSLNHTTVDGQQHVVVPRHTCVA